MPDKKRKLKEISDTDLLEGEIITEPVHKLKEIPQADLEGEIVAEPQAPPVIVDNNTIPNTIAAPQEQKPKSNLSELDPITNLPKKTYSLEEQIINQYPVLKKVAPADNFHIQYADNDDGMTLKGLGHNPEYISPNEGLVDETTPNGIVIPKGKMLVNDDPKNPKFVNVKYPNHHTTLINPSGLSEEQIKKIATNDFLSHTLHKIPEYNLLTSQLEKELKKVYGEKMVKENGGVDAYVRGIIDDSPEYKPYRDELKKVSPDVVKKLNDFVNQKEESPKEQSIKKSTDAITWLSNDIVDNADTHHPDIQNNLSSVPFHEPGSIVHDVTNPHGEPDHTSTYVKDRIAQLEKEKQAQLTAAMANGAMESATPNQNRLNELSGYYDQQINQLKQSAGSIVGLQLFNKDYKDKKYTQAEASTAMDAATKQREDAVKEANAHLHENVQGPDKYDVDKANEKFHAEVENINNNYKKEVADIQGKTKWDDVRLGLEHGRLLGDQQAEQDLAKYNSGRPLSPEAKLKYQLSGQQILKAGNAHTVNENIAKESAAHIKSEDRIEEENQQLFNDRRSAQIANAKYNDENGLFRAIVPHFGSMSKEDVEKYGKEVGLTPAQIKKIDPESVPTSSTVWQQFAKGALNTAAPIYERAVRSAAALSGVDPDKVNEAFAPGWEGQRGPGAAIVGNMPSDQNTFHNIRGAIGQVFEGAGALSTFAGEIGGVTKGLEAVGVMADKAHKLANFGVMAFNGYNNAYHDASEVIGEKPADEWKRQAYAATLGIIEGKIFSINPKADLFNKAIGIEREGELMGKDFLEEFKNAKDPSFLQDPTTEKKLARFIQQSAKDNGIQVGLAVANEMSKDAINTILNPKKKQNIPEDIKNTAVSTSLAMLIPSIMGGYHTGWNKSPIMKAAAFEIGSSPERYSQMLSDQLAAGRITPQEAQQSHEAVLTMKSVVDNTPTVSPEGKPLTPDQIKDYSWSMLRENTLQKQADQLTEQATRSNLTPDKARIEPINKQIKELQGERNKILEGKSKERVPTPEPEKPKEEPAAERSVAKQADSSEELTTEENKLGSEKEKDITLQSTEPETQKETTKTTDNERSIQNDEGRQDRTDGESSQGIRRDTEVREAADSEGRNEQKENRELKTPGTEAEPQEKQPPAASAIEESKPKKEKINRFAKIEEKVELPSEPEQVKPPEDAIIPGEEQVKEIPEQSGEREHAPVEPAGREEAPTSAESSDSHIGSEAQEEIKDVHDTNVADIPKTESETGEKPTEVPTPERSVATEPDKESEADHQKSPLTTATEAFNKYKDAVLKKEAALEKLRDQGKKKGDIDFDKKVAELEQAKNKRTEAFKAYDKEFRKDQIPNAHSLSKNIREKTKKLADEITKTRIEGQKSGTGVPKEAIEWIGNRVADLVELGENLYIAIRKSIAEYKDKGEITLENEREIKAHFDRGPEIRRYIDKLNDEPPLLHSKEDYDLSVQLSKDIRRGDDKLEDVFDDLHDANISPERKKAIADFISWQVGDKHIAAERANNEYARNSQNPLKEAKFKDDSILSDYLGVKTTKDVFGEEGFFDNENEKKVRVVLENVMGEVHNFVNLYKTDIDTPISNWGRRLMDDIIDADADPEKQVAAASGLGIELQSERIKNEKSLEDVSKQIASNPGDNILKVKRAELLKEGNKIKELLKEMQNFKKKLLSKASATMNYGRLDRLLRNEILHEHYEKAILSEKERKDKSVIEKTLKDSIIDDYKNHPEYIKERKLSDEAIASKKRAATEDSQKNPSKESVAEKVKKTARIIKKSLKSKKEYKAAKEAAAKEFGVNEKGEKMTAKDFLEHLKKLKNPC